MGNIIRVLMLVAGLFLPLTLAWGQEPVTTITKFGKIELYGFIWSSMEYKTSKAREIDLGGPALPGGSEEEDRGIFTFNVKPTRVGLRLTAPDVLGAKNTGLLEIDFRGSSGRNPGIRMRHGYWQLAWPVGKASTVRALGGQTWHLFFPPGITSFDFAGGSATGYLFGGRITQARFGFDTKPTKDTGLNFDLALIPPQSNASAAGFSTLTTGTAKQNVPFGQGRVSFTFPFLAPGTKIELTGSVGREKQGRPDESITHWAGMTHLVVPYSIFTLRGAIWGGEDLNMMGSVGNLAALDNGTFLSGGGTRGAGTASLHGIKEAGGWVELGAKLTPTVRVTAAYGLDDVMNPPRTLTPTAGRTTRGVVSRNEGLFTTVTWQPAPTWELTLGYNYITTEYRRAPTGDDHRFGVKVLRYF